MSIQTFPHQVTRLIFDVGQPYEKFRGRYEAAVPAADPRWPDELSGRHARWPDIARDLDGSSPDGFFLYWRANMSPCVDARYRSLAHGSDDPAGQLRAVAPANLGHRASRGTLDAPGRQRGC